METTLATGRADHPPVAQKAPHKIFHQERPAEEEAEGALSPQPASTLTAAPPTKRGPRIEKDGCHRYKFFAEMPS